MAQDEKAVAKAEPKRVTKAAEPTAAGNPVDSSSVSKGRVNSESSAGKTQAIHIPVAIAIIVALSSIYYGEALVNVRQPLAVVWRLLTVY